MFILIALTIGWQSMALVKMNRIKSHVRNAIWNNVWSRVWDGIDEAVVWKTWRDAMGDLNVPAALNVKASVFEHYKKKEP